MAKETKGAETPGAEEKKTCSDAAALLCKTEPREREMFGKFMLAVAGRDDANYKTGEKIADDAAALTALYMKRAGQFKG